MGFRKPIPVLLYLQIWIRCHNPFVFKAPSGRLLVPLAVLTSSPSWCLVPFVHVLISLDGLAVFWQSGLSGVSCHRLDKSGTSCALSLAARSEERRVGK